ncbi:MAG: protein kinase [archaeon]|nr:protein kinase [archaeon]
MSDSEQESESINENDPNLEEIQEIIHKKNGSEYIKRYVKGKFLGKGGFAKCYELKNVDNKKVFAGKIISKANLERPSAKNKLKSEIKIHQAMNHHNIVKFDHYFEDDDNVYMLLELCKSKTLNELIKKRKILTEIEVRYYLNQILAAVKYMHKNKVIHRDLKLGNLFLSANLEIKIGDFGLATRVEYDGERKHTVCGTPNYIAPEILENKSEGHSYEVDYWAIGVIVYTLIIGRPPFETDDVKETYKRINENSYEFPSHVYISENAKDFIKKTLVSDPNQRLNPDKMYSHPFMTETEIPKELPHYTLKNPPKIDFFRTYNPSKKIENISDISFRDPKEEKKLEEMEKFASKNVKKNEDMNNAFINYAKSKNPLKLLDLSLKKESHNLLKRKLEEYDMNKLIYCDMVFDYTEKFGVLFKMHNSNLFGCVFNDKSTLFKYFGRNTLFYENKKKKIAKIFDPKNVITSLKQKYEIVSNFEKYLIGEKEKNFTSKPILPSKEINIENSIFIHKVIKTELAMLLKFSNKLVQLTFKDDTKIIIDKDVEKRVFFFDKNDKRYNYSIHLVNKSHNKRFLNRYEHYKKVFFEKMDERFQKLHEENSDKEDEKEEEIEEEEKHHHHHHSHQNHDLNKTT